MIGAGYFASYHAEAWHRLPGCVLAGVCDLDVEAASRLGQGAATFCDAAQMLQSIEIDLIDIATPSPTHAQFIDMAISSGIPAICQKPLAPDWQGAKAIADRVKAAGHKVVVHENFRFQPWYRQAKKLIQTGAIGHPLSISFRLRPGDGRGPQAYLDRQPYFQTMPRFLIHETGIHFIDTFRYLMGEINRVSAQLRRINPAIEGEDAGIIYVGFANGATGVFDGNRLATHNAANPRLTMGEMWIDGDEATLKLDGDGNLWRTPHGGGEQRVRYEWTNRAFGGDCVATLQQHMIAHLRYNSPIENEIHDYMRNIEIEEAIYRSHLRQQIIDVPLA